MSNSSAPDRPDTRPPDFLPVLVHFRQFYEQAVTVFAQEVARQIQSIARLEQLNHTVARTPECSAATEAAIDRLIVARLLQERKAKL